MKDLFWGFTFLISQAVSPACRLLSLCCCLHASSVFAPARSLSVWTQQSLHPAKCCLTENTQKNIKTIFVFLYTWQSRPQLPLFSHKLKILILVILFLVELQCFYLKAVVESNKVHFNICTILTLFYCLLKYFLCCIILPLYTTLQFSVQLEGNAWLFSPLISQL